MRVRDNDHVHLLETMSQAKAVVEEQLCRCERLFVRCEGENLSRHGKMHLMQIGDACGNVYLFDIEALGAEGCRESGLKSILQDISVEKVMWDCRESADALYYQLGIELTSVFDLQLLRVVTVEHDKESSDAQCYKLQTLQCVAKQVVEADEFLGADGSHVSVCINQRPFREEVLEHSVNHVVILRKLFEALGADLEPGIKAEVRDASARYALFLRAKLKRSFCDFEKLRSPWAGPFLPWKILSRFGPEFDRLTESCTTCLQHTTQVGQPQCGPCEALEKAYPAESWSAAMTIPKGQKPPLNALQEKAVSMVLDNSAGDICIIFGPPGCGKTYTLVRAIMDTLEHNENARILCTAPSNSAADLLATRLVQYLRSKDLFRMYARTHDPKIIPPELRRYSLRDREGVMLPEANTIESFKVVVSTCSSASYLYSLGISAEHFTHVFVDEAGQASEPETLVSITAAPKASIVLVGDSKQLGPIIRSPAALRNGLSKSLLARAFENQRVPFIQLTDSYRAHRSILELYSSVFYASSLIACALPCTTNRFLNWNRLPDKRHPILFQHVEGTEKRDPDSPSWYNMDEIEVVMDLIDDLCSQEDLYVQKQEIGIICPYIKQKKKLERQLSTFDPMNRLQIGTVENFQGRELPVIILSTVRSRPENLFQDRKFQLGFLNQAPRANVAVSRASGLLVVVGNMFLLSLDPIWRSLIQCALRFGAVQGLPDGFTMESVQRESTIRSEHALLLDPCGNPVHDSEGNKLSLPAGSTVQLIGSDGKGLLRVSVGDAQVIGYIRDTDIGVNTKVGSTSANVETPWLMEM